jgi:tRNA dimethylallyltransferase
MRLILIIGATTTGKTDLSIELAHSLNQHYKNINKQFKNQKIKDLNSQSSKSSHYIYIVNCDSRQVYKGLDLGTGKVNGQHATIDGITAYWSDQIPHFLIDFVDPKNIYSVATFQSDFEKLIKDLEKKNPSDRPKDIILTGGSGYFANQILMPTAPKILPEFITEYNDIKSRLNELNLHQLQNIFQITKKRELNNSDYNNKIRLVNYLTLIEASSKGYTKTKPNNYLKYFDSIIIFQIDKPLEILKSDIETRTKMRFDKGLIEEVKKNLYLGNRLTELGLEYGIIYDYLTINSQNIKNDDELVKILVKANLKLVKKQNTWLKKFDSIKVQNLEQIKSHLKI